MGNYAVVGNARLFGVALVGLTAIALLSGGEALAAGGVGVTSAADGDPLGKPPNENERILRIGIDVQANELITTSANDRAHLVFLDGSSLTVGPDARVTIDRFVFDPNTQKGDLAINASDYHHHTVEHDRHPRRHHDRFRHPGPDGCRFRLR